MVAANRAAGLRYSRPRGGSPSLTLDNLMLVHPVSNDEAHRLWPADVVLGCELVDAGEHVGLEANQHRGAFACRRTSAFFDIGYDSRHK